MKCRLLRAGVILVGLISFISTLVGCGINGGKEENWGKTVTLSDGATLTGFYMNHTGMAMEPYYIMRVCDDGNYMKITTRSPEFSESAGGEDDIRFANIKTVLDEEHASLVTVGDDVVKELYDICIESGALSWDGYSKSVSMDYVLDAGDSYNLFLEFSDGSTVTVGSYNSSPTGWSDFSYKVSELFEAHEDYSRYSVSDFREAPLGRMIIEFSDGLSNPSHHYKVDICLRPEVGTWDYSVVLKDSDGKYLDAGTDIHEYENGITGSPDIESFLRLFEKYNLEKWDNVSGNAGDDRDCFSIMIYFDNDKSITANGNIHPDNYEEFKADFVNTLSEYYETYIRK